MDPDIAARKTTLHKMLGRDASSQVRVPDYQRGYSWESKHFTAFFEDITDFSETRKRGQTDVYFLGPIVIMQGHPTDEYFYLVDGQQRLATSLILLATIRDLAAEIPGPGSVGSDLADDIHRNYVLSEGPDGGDRWTLRLGDLDQPFFQKFVQRMNRQADLFPRNASNGLIKQARNYFDGQLRAKIGERSVPLDYLRRLYECLTRHVVMIAVHVANDRDAMDVFERINDRGKPLSEADLVRHRLMRSARTKGDRNEVRKCWDKIENLLGTEAKTDKFLRDMWVSRTGDLKASKLYDAISEYLVETDESVVAFAEDCVENCHAYAELLKPHSTSIHHEGREAVRATHATLGVKIALPLFLSAYCKLRKTPEFSRLARAVESLVVRHRFFAAFDVADLKAALYRAARQVHGAPSKDVALERALATLKEVDPSDQQVISGVRRKMKMTKLQAVYILRQLETLNTYPDDSFRAEATLEHIFPVKATPDQWKRCDLLTPYLWHLGNLTLLTSADNRKASNKKWTFKKNKVYRSAKLRLTADIAEHRKWGREPILNRAQELARIAARRWSLD